MTDLTARLDSMFEEQPRDMAWGAFDGADRLEQHLAWVAVNRAPDTEILQSKDELDARAKDMARNDGFVASGATLHQDHIVGSRFILNAKPRSSVLFGTEDPVWEVEFQNEVEELFTLWAESDDRWVDAARRNTLTDQVRLAIRSFSTLGEILGVTKWMPDDGRAFQTSTLVIDPQRLAKQLGIQQKPNRIIRGGVERNDLGAPIAYHIWNRYPGEAGPGTREVVRVMARKPNGRQQVIHIFEQLRPDQSRGIAAITTALSEMRMLQKLRRIEIARAATAATYAATIETDQPPAEAYSMLGADASNPMTKAAADHLSMLSNYAQGAKGLHMDGVKIPVLPLGSKLNLQSSGNASPIGSDLEASFMRHLAATFGLSYEQFSRDFSKSNYSSTRAAMGETLLYTQALKRRTADRYASYVYRLWFEEAIHRGSLTTVKGSRFPSFYEGLNADAYCACEWIGAGQGQVDQMKETQAAALRLRTGISTLEQECARLGIDWRAIQKQRAREHEEIKASGLPSPFEQEKSPAENAATGEPRKESE